MPYDYKVEYSTTANTGTWVELDNVQDIRALLHNTLLKLHLHELIK